MLPVYYITFIPELLTRWAINFPYYCVISKRMEAVIIYF